MGFVLSMYGSMDTATDGRNHVLFYWIDQISMWSITCQ